MADGNSWSINGGLNFLTCKHLIGIIIVDSLCHNVKYSVG